MDQAGMTSPLHAIPNATDQASTASVRHLGIVMFKNILSTHTPI